LISASIALSACGSDSGEGAIDVDAAPPATAFTYYQDVKPLIDGMCGSCHVEGGIGPFVMNDYATAKAHAGPSMIAINAGIMPPWAPNDACNSYHGDRSLSDEQKAVFNGWVDGGTLEGDPNNEADPLNLDMPQLSRVDKTLTMETSYMPSKAPDDYRCFLLPWPAEFDADKFVTGFSVTPGNAKIVHHVIAFIAGPDQRDEYLQLDADEAGPGYTCFGGSGGSAQAGLGGWVPGTRGSDLPEGTGIKVEAGSTIILQVHYNTVDGAAVTADTTSLDLKLEDTVIKEGAMMGWLDPQWLNGSMPIAAGDADAKHSFSFSPLLALQFLGATSANEITVYSAGLHMHQLGKSAKLELSRGGAEKDCLVQIDDWDFNWQGDYTFTEPMKMGSGDQLAIDCAWDNSMLNQPMVDGTPLPPKNVNWGEGTSDEMCLGSFYWTE
jgi:hypothetical protein